MMKVRPSFKKMLITALVVFLFSASVIFATCFNIFVFQDWGYIQWLIIAAFVVTSILIFVFSFMNYFYVIKKKELIVVKFRRAFNYPYSDIIYIEQNSKKKNATITIIMKSGQSIYLMPDLQNQVYQSLSNNCDHLLSKAEIQQKFPRIKL
ncbi:MAG TPA: hypothetical protein PLR04_02815 [Bacilli bacterium]|nr:hypothetical protein [Bacilli bacterium]